MSELGYHSGEADIARGHSPTAGYGSITDPNDVRSGEVYPSRKADSLTLVVLKTIINCFRVVRRAATLGPTIGNHIHHFFAWSLS